MQAESQRVLERGKGPVISFTKLWINPQTYNFYQKKKKQTKSINKEPLM